MIRVDLTGDEALQLMLALDTALITLQSVNPAPNLSQRELDHSAIQLRDLRQTIFQKRADALSAIIKRKS